MFEVEFEVCRRCNGSGKYSFNRKDRDICYGCVGNGKVQTKESKLKQSEYIESISILGADIKVGDRVRIKSLYNSDKFNITVASISTHPHPVGGCVINIKSKNGNDFAVFDDQKVIKLP